MKNKLWIGTIFGILVIASGCSTAKVRVMPGENGTNRVIARDIERDDAEEAAYKAAEKYCDKQNKHAVYTSTAPTQYTGKMDESTRNTVRNVSKVAMVLSPGVGVGTQNAPLGGALGAAGTAGYGMTSDRDYTSDLQFRCQ